ncbi:MAG TPA: hypothetical protein VKU82_10935, partial [Planctomycetaceae bacterium]|nr:hypothetical protein [Planctomycetaceae bacterium]
MSLGVSIADCATQAKWSLNRRVRRRYIQRSVPLGRMLDGDAYASKKGKAGEHIATPPLFEFCGELFGQHERRLLLLFLDLEPGL